MGKRRRASDATRRAALAGLGRMPRTARKGPCCTNGTIAAGGRVVQLAVAAQGHQATVQGARCARQRCRRRHAGGWGRQGQRRHTPPQEPAARANRCQLVAGGWDGDARGPRTVLVGSRRSCAGTMVDQHPATRTRPRLHRCCDPSAVAKVSRTQEWPSALHVFIVRHKSWLLQVLPHNPQS